MSTSVRRATRLLCGVLANGAILAALIVAFADIGTIGQSLDNFLSDEISDCDSTDVLDAPGIDLGDCRARHLECALCATPVAVVCTLSHLPTCDVPRPTIRVGTDHFEGPPPSPRSPPFFGSRSRA